MGFPFRITGRRFFKLFLPEFWKYAFLRKAKNKVGIRPGKIKWGIFSGKSKPDFSGLIIGRISRACI